LTLQRASSAVPSISRDVGGSYVDKR